MTVAAAALPGFALVTGATAGLGAGFARQLAAEGRDLVLVARTEERLESVAAELRARHGVQVEVLVADLATDDGCAAVAARVSQPDRPVDTLVNNAGIGLYRAFGTAPLADERRLLDLNVTSVLTLSHAAVTAMTARGRGEIINVSSVAGFVPRGASTTYAASKAWVTSFSEGLALLLQGTGVSAAAICPGFTRTEFHARAKADMSSTPAWMWLAADRVVAEGLADVRAGAIVSVPSRRYKGLLLLVKVLPRTVVRWVVSRR